MVWVMGWEQDSIRAPGGAPRDRGGVRVGMGCSTGGLRGDRVEVEVEGGAWHGAPSSLCAWGASTGPDPGLMDGRRVESWCREW
jgi:hypothetical protein